MVEKKSIQQRAQDISVPIAKKQDVMEARQPHKMTLAEDQLTFKKERNWMSEASEFFLVRTRTE